MKDPHPLDSFNLSELSRLALDGRPWANWYCEAWFAIESICTPRHWDSVRFACALSALSPRVAVKRNVGLMAALTRGEDRQGLTATWDKAHTIWFNAAVGHQWASKMLTTADELPPGQAYKTACFAANLTGHHEPVTIDSWMMRAFRTPLKMMSSRPLYVGATKAIQTVADGCGMTPAACQSAIWHAYAFENGRQTMGNFCELLLGENWGAYDN